MVTLKDFLLRTFGSTEVIVIEKDQLHPLGAEAMKESALYHGSSFGMRDKALYNRYVYSYGVVDNCLIIELQ